MSFTATAAQIKQYKRTVRKLGLTKAQKAIGGPAVDTLRRYVTSDVGGPPVVIARRGRPKKK